MDRYDPQQIEPKWQEVWEDARAFYVSNPGSLDRPERDKFYMLEMLPYPAGDLHMGHVLNYTLGDVVTHFRRRNGQLVLRPMGFDSFGLPAENAAIREGGHPREITERNIANIRRQMRRLGWAIDWDREVSAHEPEYYRWTQWLFLKFLEAGLAYRKASPVNWCPNDQTVLANEQVVDGRCERCGCDVTKRSLTQWYFRITEYAQRLLDDMAQLEGTWPERVLLMQRNWIGRSEGAYVDFRIDHRDEPVTVFTTRPDTLWGATFFVVAADSDLAAELVTDEHRAAFEHYLDDVRRLTDIDRLSTDREKTGVFLGRYAVNPVNGEALPVWAADYVLADYGTGAIMAVPAHDQRDLDFARRFALDVRLVVDTGEPNPG